jgi:ABC-type dipeptide/oligopeptide/nickel transport system ATPase component
MCEKLYDVDAKAQVVPQLAASMPTVAKDRKTLTIPLRQGVRLNEGTPAGCPFRTRCPLEQESRPQSEQETPGLIDVGDGHLVACLLARHGRQVPRVA